MHKISFLGAASLQKYIVILVLVAFGQEFIHKKRAKNHRTREKWHCKLVDCFKKKYNMVHFLLQFLDKG